MFHTETTRLIETWSQLPGASRIPDRQDLDALSLGPLVTRLFLLEYRPRASRIRLAGDWIEALHGRPLSGHAWRDLWDHASLPLVESALAQCLREIRPVILTGDCPRLPGGIEMPLVPLRGPSGRADRIIGLYRPRGFGQPVSRSPTRLSAHASLAVGEPPRARPQLIALQGRRVA
jgi:hypothetical protein